MTRAPLVAAFRLVALLFAGLGAGVSSARAASAPPVLFDHQRAGSSVSGGPWSSLQLDRQGRPHIAFYDHDRHALQCARKDGSTWSVELVDSMEDAGAWCSLALDANGDAHIGYLAGSTGRVRHAWQEGGTWRTETVDSAIGSGSAGVSLALDSGGRPRIAYCGSTGGLRFASKDAATWTLETAAAPVASAAATAGFPTPASVPDDGGGLPAPKNRLAWPSLVLDARDQPHVSYSASAGNGSGDRVLYYVLRSRSGGWTSEPVIERGVASSLRLDASGGAHLAFVSGGDSLLHAWRGAQGGWNFEFVDSQAAPRWAPSLALDARGTPHVAYAAGGTLRFAATSSGNWYTYAADDSSGHGSGVSLILDAQGNPRMSYCDGAHGIVDYGFAPVGEAVVPGAVLAEAQDGGVDLRWPAFIGTSLTVRVLRASSESGPYQAVSAEMEPAMGQTLFTFSDPSPPPGGEYFYKIGYCQAGSWTYSPAVRVQIGSGSLALRAPVPNPTPGPARIAFDLDRAGDFSLDLYAVSGARVRHLAPGDGQPGPHSATLDGRDDAGRSLASGIYFIRLTSGGRVLTRKLSVLR